MRFRDFLKQRIKISPELLKEENLTEEEFYQIYLQVPVGFFPVTAYGFSKETIRDDLFNLVTDYVIQEIDSISVLKRIPDYHKFFADVFVGMFNRYIEWSTTDHEIFWRDLHYDFEEFCSNFKDIL